MTIEIKKLNSNITVLFDKFNSNTLSMGMWLDVGSTNETSSEYGIAHMLEHMAFKGTKNRSASEIASAIEDVGGDINAYTSKESTAYYLKLLPEHMSLGVDILSDILINSNFPKEEIERERGVILSEIGLYNDTPDDKVFENFNKTAFKGQSLGMSILGTKKTVKNFQQNDLIDFFKKFYNSSNLIIGICGNFNQIDVEKQIINKFKDLRSGNKNIKPNYNWHGGKNLEEKDLEQTHLVYGLEG